MKFTVITLGCKVNAYESESYVRKLKDHGYTYVSNKDISDIYIINSCAVTNAAATKTRQRINQASRLNPEAMIVLVGCYAQVETNKLMENSKIDLIVGSNKKSQLADLILETLAGKKVVAVDKYQRDFEYEDLGVFSFSNQQRAFLKVQDGCDQFCSYCIIPYARGKERSQLLESVIDNAKFLVDKGHQEIVLTGIHTGRYGSDIETSLSNLMEKLLNEVTKLKRLRVSSIEVLEINEEIINLAKSNDKIANHWHIPLQAGSDAILRKMNRRYTKAQYFEVVQYLRDLLPNVAISADIIVGFPGETNEDFNETYNFVKDLKLSFLHVFPYSPKTNTVAANLDNQVDGTIKKQRVNKLLALSEKLKHDYIESFISKSVSVLVEGNEDGYYKGYSSEYFEVKIKSNEDITNSFVNVLIEEVKGDIGYGTTR